MQGLITQRQFKDNYGTDCDRLEKDYVVFFESLGFDLIPVSNFQKKNFNADFLILTGGGSINAEQPERDKIEEKLFKEALHQNKPIIGICRGMQYINILLGGDLSKNAVLKIARPNNLDHKVIADGKEVMVNNFHDDVIFSNQLSQSLEILAKDEDNDTVEAFYSKEKRILGIQWHPERTFSQAEGKEYSKKLIKDFLTYGEIR